MQLGIAVASLQYESDENARETKTDDTDETIEHIALVVSLQTPAAPTAGRPLLRRIGEAAAARRKEE